jgi:uncharacterized membrane protein YjgN (DUF898 family)
MFSFLKTYFKTLCHLNIWYIYYHTKKMVCLHHCIIIFYDVHDGYILNILPINLITLRKKSYEYLKMKKYFKMCICTSLSTFYIPWSVHIMLISHRDCVMSHNKLYGIKNNESGMMYHRSVMAYFKVLFYHLSRSANFWTNYRKHTRTCCTE